MDFPGNLCYYLTGDSMETKLVLIPINETKDSDKVINITLDWVEKIAFIATTLTPLDEFSEIDGYTGALWEHMQELKYQDKGLFTIYDKLIHANSGFNLLKTAVQLFLIEKNMRNHGITNEMTSKYNSLQNEYQSLINDIKKD